MEKIKHIEFTGSKDDILNSCVESIINNFNINIEIKENEKRVMVESMKKITDGKGLVILNSNS